jgi:hypothetical protein
MLNFFTDPSKPKWLGIFYAILLSASILAQITLMQVYFHTQFIVALRSRAAIAGLVYRKVRDCHSNDRQAMWRGFLQSLRLSNGFRQEITTGEIVNLVRIDSSSIPIYRYSYWTDGD